MTTERRNLSDLRNRDILERYTSDDGALAVLHSAVLALKRVRADEAALRQAATADPDMRVVYQNLGDVVSTLHWEAIHIGSLLPLETDTNFTSDTISDII